MSINREAIEEALAARLRATGAFITVSRKMAHFEEVPAPMQPAAYLVKATEVPADGRSTPTVWTLHLFLFIYCRVEAAPAGVPGSQINAILAAVEDALARQPGEAVMGPGGAELVHTTLGGLVSRCRIGGAIDLDEGLADNQTIIRIPVEITAGA
jgi:hypothetical protein